MPDFVRGRITMVDRQIRTAGVTDHAVLAAFLDLPREPFLPKAQRTFAYSDVEVPVGAGRKLMEPAVLGLMVEAAALGPGDVVLDVGCATGYSSAALARLAGSVVALESDPALASAATMTLIDLDILNVAVVTGPLANGWPAEAPFDAIVVGGSVDAVPPTLLAQLKEGGRLVAPVGTGPAGQVWLFRRSDGDVAGTPLFNAPVPPLPGFARPRTFAF